MGNALMKRANQAPSDDWPAGCPRRGDYHGPDAHARYTADFAEYRKEQNNIRWQRQNDMEAVMVALKAGKVSRGNFFDLPVSWKRIAATRGIIDATYDNTTAVTHFWMRDQPEFRVRD